MSQVFVSLQMTVIRGDSTPVQGDINGVISQAEYNVRIDDPEAAARLDAFLDMYLQPPVSSP